MSQEIENKVVEFQFNNQNFEKNVKKSMSTLDRLKKALNFDNAEKSFSKLDKATKNFSLDSMEKNVDGLGKKFSALETIATGALLTIGNQAMVAGERLVKALTVDQIAAGFDKYSQKVQAVATIMSATGLSMDEIEKHLENLNTYTDKTSYGFSQMVDNVGKFTSAGVDLEEAVLAMEGIGNWASLSGVTAASGKAAIAMYNLSQAMGQGYLLMQDWRSIENVNMATQEFKNALIETGLAVGNLVEGTDGLIYTLKGTEVNAENLRGSLADRWVDKNVMLSTLMRYSDETDELGQKAYKAAAEARTLEDAVGAVNDAISTSWMKTEEMIFGDYEEATKFWTGLQDYVLAIFDKTMSARQEIFGGALQNTAWTQLKDIFDDLSVSEENFEERLYRAAKAQGIAIDDMIEAAGSIQDLLYSEYVDEQLLKIADTLDGFSFSFEDRVKKMARQHGIAIDQMIEEEGSLREVVKTGVIDQQIIANVFGEYSAELLRAAAASDLNTKSMSEFEKVVRQTIRGDFGEGEERVRNLNAMGYNATEVLAEVNKLYTDIGYGISWISDEQFEAIGFTREEIRQLRMLAEQATITGTDMFKLIDELDRPSGRDLLIDTLYNALNGLVKVVETLKEAWASVFPAFTAERFYNIIKAVNEFSKRLIMSEETADKFRRTFKGVFAVADIFAKILKTGLSRGLKSLSGFLKNATKGFWDTTAAIGDNLVRIHDWIIQNGQIEKSFDTIGEYARKVADHIKAAIEAFLALPGVQSALAWIETKWNSLVSSSIEWLVNNNGIAGVVEAIAKWLEKAYQAARDFVAALFEGFDFEGAWQDVRAFFSKIKQALANIFSVDTINKIKNAGGGLAGLKAVFADLKVGAQQDLGEAGKFLSSLWKKIKIWAGGIAGSLDGLGEGIRNTFNRIGKFISENVAGLIPIAVVAGMVVGFKAISKVIKLIIGFLQPFQNLVDSFAARNRAAAFATRVNAVTNGLKDISISLLLVVGTLKLLETLKNANGTISNFITILTALVVSLGMVALISRFVLNNKALDMTGIGLALIGVGFGVLALVGALKILEFVDQKDIWQRVLVLLALVGMMLGVFTAVSFLAQGNKSAKLSKGILFSLALSGAVYIMVKSLQKIADMDEQSVKDGMKVLEELMVAILILTAVSTKATFGSAFTILSIAATFIILAKACDMFGSVNAAGLQRVLALFLPMLFLLIGALGSTKLAGKNALGAGVTMIGIAAAMYAMAKAMVIIADIPEDKIAAAAGGILALLVFLGGIIWSTKYSGANAAKAAVTVLAAAAAAIVLAGAMWMLAKIPSDKIAGAIVAIIAIGGVLAAIVASTRDTSNALGTLLGLAVIVTILGVILIILAHNPNPEAVILSAVGLGVVLLALAGTMDILEDLKSKLAKGVLGNLYALLGVVAILGLILGAMSYFPQASNAFVNAAGISLLLIAMSYTLQILSKVNAGKAKESVATLAVLGIIVGLLAGIFYLFQDFKGDIGSVLALAAGISTVLIAMAAAMVILELCKAPSAAAVGTMLILVVVVGLIALMFHLCQDIRMEANKMLDFAASLSVILLAMTAALFFLQFINPIAGIAGVLGLIAFVAITVAFVAALGYAAQEWAWLAPSIETGLELLKTIAAGLGEAITSFFSGALLGLVSKLPEVAVKIGLFVSILKASFAGIDENMLNAALIIADLILAFTAAELIDGIAKFFTLGQSGLDKFGGELEGFGKHLKTFASETSTIKDPDRFAKVAEAANNIAQIATYIPTDIPTVEAMDQFGEGLETFARHMRAFGTNAKNTDLESVDKAAESGKKLAQFANLLGGQSGFLQLFTGETMGLDEFGQQIRVFGYSLVQFGNSAKLIAEKNVDMGPAIDMANQLQQLTNALAPEGGFIGAIFGEQGLGNFGQDISTFGEAIVKYASAVSGLTDADVTQADLAYQIAKPLADMTVLLSAKNFWDAATNTDDIGNFGQRLATFAGGVVQYSQALLGLETEAVNNAFPVIRQITMFVSTFAETAGGMSEASAATTQLSYFVADMERLLTLLATEGNESTVDNLNNLQRAISNFAIDPRVFEENAESNLAHKIVLFFEGITESVKESLDGFTGLGSNIIDQIVQGITDNADKIKNALDQVMAESVANFRVELSQFNANSYIPQSEPTATSISTGAPGSEFLDYLDFGGMEIPGIDTAANDILEQFSSYAPQMAPIGTDYMDQLTNIGFGDYNFDIPLSNTNDGIQAGLESFFPDYQSRGATSADFMMDGWMNEISARTPEFLQQMRNLGIDADLELRSGGGIESPSWKTAEAAMYFLLGWTNSIDKNSPAMLNQVRLLGEDTVYALNEAIAGAEYSIEDYEPVIRPVVDLSNIKSGAQYIDSIVDTMRASKLGSYIGFGMNQKLVRDQNGKYNDINVVRGLTALRTDISSLGTKMGNMKIVMDTGATVGALSAGIDRSIGTTRAHYERGI